ncbi:MAG: PAS domain S-box protein, partial [Burkholderiales bacterium]|nr:PAS domain S-box protein [Burkholderiales bacterium]
MALPPGDTSEPGIQQTLLEYQAILENASVGILFTRDRKVLHCNPRASEIYGWPQGELVGQPGSVFYPSQEAYETIGRQAGPLLARGELLDVELPMRRKDDSEVYCHMRAKAIDPANTAEGTIWIIEDISERKREQATLDELLQRQQAILENASV